MSLAYSTFITPMAALALVLGANLGSAINPVFEGGHRGDASSYRLPVGNLINRLVGVVLVAPFLHPIADAMRAFQPDMARMTAEFHMAFNIAAGGRLHRPARPARPAAGEAVAGAQGRRRSSLTALSRRDRARDALAGAGRRCPRDAAHGRPRRGHAAPGHARPYDQRPGARARGLAHGQRGRQARRGHQALRHQADARQPRRARGPPGHGDHLLHHQPRARRRHHRQEPDRAGRQEDQAQVPVLQRGRARSWRRSTSASWRACGSRSSSSCPATSRRRAG